MAASLCVFLDYFANNGLVYIVYPTFFKKYIIQLL